MSTFSELIKDDAGELSCMRLLVVVVVLTVLGVWVWNNIRSGTPVPLGTGEAGIIGAAVGGKAVQGYFEYGR